MLKAKAAMEKRRKDAAAKKIQALYRGHRGRLSTYIIMMEYHEMKEKQNNAARVIQRFWEYAQKHSPLLKASAKNLLLLVGQAKLYTQYYDDSVGQMFYHNASTDESLWEPPASGYISKDGVYVLANGQELDPAVSKSLGKASWKKFMDEDSKKPFWYNSATGAIAWTNPLPDVELPFSDESEMDGISTVDGGAAANNHSHLNQITNHESTAEWTEYFDETTNQPYWGNANGETTWNNPYT